MINNIINTAQKLCNCINILITCNHIVSADQFLSFGDTSELTKGDIEKRFRAYETACKNGFMQIDEIRRWENMPPLGLDFVRLGLQDVLYDPVTKQFYMPNMNQTGGLGQKESEPEQKEGEKKDED